MFSLVLADIVTQIVILGVFSFCWHTVADTYRTVACGHGAFELCLPSLGILYQINLLRQCNIYRTGRFVRLLRMATRSDRVVYSQ